MQGFLFLVVFFIVISVAIVFIGQNNGWDNAGCHGNCAKCHKSCDSKNNPPQQQ